MWEGCPISKDGRHKQKRKKGICEKPFFASLIRHCNTHGSVMTFSMAFSIHSPKKHRVKQRKFSELEAPHKERKEIEKDETRKNRKNNGLFYMSAFKVVLNFTKHCICLRK